MTYLSLLSPELRDMVVRLPYRVGLYLSESDTTGGDESAEAERTALENIVTFYVEDTVKGEFAHEVMNETLRHKDDWKTWGDNSIRVADECKAMQEMLIGVIDMKEVEAFKHNLLDIAIVVAQAYREFDRDAGALDRLRVYIALFLKRLKAALNGEAIESNEQILNISSKEEAAIQHLATVMNIKIDL